MDFEFDPAKSEANRAKHGIDFVTAQAIWQDGQRFEVPGRFKGEQRSLVIGEISGVLWTACVTYRGDVVRIISVRRARHDEEEAYETL